jgi:hypothetical protein
MDRVSTLCTKAILLDHGELICEGKPAEVIARYTQGINHSRPDDHQGPIRVQKIEADNDLPVASGSEVSLALSGTISESAFDSGAASILLQVRSTETGTVPFSTNTAQLGIELPGPGEFRLDVVLQMNLSPGVYIVESGVIDERRGTVISQGPKLSVQVARGPSFAGSVQLNPRVSVASLPRA